MKSDRLFSNFSFPSYIELVSNKTKPLNENYYFICSGMMVSMNVY